MSIINHILEFLYSIPTIFYLLAIFQVKHFISDYPLQCKYMLQKAQHNNWVFPLMAHALVYATFTLLIVLFFNPSFWYLAIVDFIVHFAIDRVKASPNLFNIFGIDNKYFWWSFGADQMMHHLTHYFFIYMVVSNV